eukprot:GFYU01004319.1.p1 GENE.GFYU01004319.1~~GFYU01004319.1.p1  ORF type:complete len:189 (-),score=34.27 GFYU01004319.1:266-763(-)
MVATEIRFEKFFEWINESPGSNLVTFKAAFDVFLVVFWLINALLSTHTLYKALCSPLWTEDKCSSWVLGHMGNDVLSGIVPLTVMFLCFYFCRKSIMARKARGYQMFFLLMWVHIYLNIIWLITVISRSMWLFLGFMVLGITQDLYVLVRVQKYRDAMTEMERLD